MVICARHGLLLYLISPSVGKLDASAACRPDQTLNAIAAQNFVMFAAGGLGDFTRLALYSSIAFSAGPITHSYHFADVVLFVRVRSRC